MTGTASGEPAPSQRRMLTVVAEAFVKQEECGTFEQPRATVLLNAATAEGQPVTGLQGNNFSATQCNRLTGDIQIVPIASVIYSRKLELYEIKLDLSEVNPTGIPKSPVFLHICQAVVKNGILEISRARCKINLRHES